MTSTFLENFNTFLTFFSRPVVLVQCGLSIVAVLLTVLVSRVMWRWLGWREEIQASVARRFLYLLRDLTFPVLGWLALLFVVFVLQSQGHPYGLVARFETVFIGTLLGYSLLLWLLGFVVPPEHLARDNRAFFRPLVVVVVLLQLLDVFMPLRRLAAAPVAQVFEGTLTLGGVFAATVGLYFWITLTGLLKDVTYAYFVQRRRADAGSTEGTLTLVRYGLMVVGIVWALNQLQIRGSTLATITAGLSVGIGFGLQEVLSNFVAGILLLFEKSLRPGDVIDFRGELCRVQKVNIRSTTVRMGDKSEKIIPNRVFLSEAITTFTGSDSLLGMSIPITLSRSLDPNEVVETLTGIANAHPDILKTPPPGVSLKDLSGDIANFLGATGVNYILSFTIDEPMKQYKIRNEINQAIIRKFHLTQQEVRAGLGAGQDMEAVKDTTTVKGV